jgi:transcriptional regulator with XRE-family HTH domain
LPYTKRVENKFGARVKQRMGAVGITQVELAQRVGVGQAQISRLLKGERGTDLETIKRIAMALGESQQLYINLYADLPMTKKDIYILEIEADIEKLQSEQDKERVRQFIRLLSGDSNPPRPKTIRRGQRAE